MKVELYFYRQCPFCQLVLRKIDELSLGEKIHYRDILRNEDFRQQHQQITGRATVPCLYIDSKPLFESSDICRWLEEHSSKMSAKDTE